MGVRSCVVMQNLFNFFNNYICPNKIFKKYKNFDWYTSIANNISIVEGIS